MVTNNNRKFKGIWIPREIWLNKELSLQEKIFLVEIDSLSGEEGCFASNRYFATFFNLSLRRTQGVLQGLKERNLIFVNFEYDNNEINKRIIKINKMEINNLYKNGMSKLTRGNITSDVERGVNSDGENIVNSDTHIINKKYNKENHNINYKKQRFDKRPIKQSLLPKEDKKLKKAKDIKTMLSLINLFSDNQKVISNLKTYFNFRIKRGLQVEQWKLILDNLKKYQEDNKISNTELAKKIEYAFSSGYMQIIPEWEMKPKKQARSFDTSANNEIDENEEGVSGNAIDENGKVYNF